MKRIAVLSDIHGNLMALREAAREIQEWAPDRIWFLGDAVVFGPDPGECLAVLRDELCPSVCIQGNTERYLTESSWRQGGGHPEAVVRALKFAEQALDANDHQQLAAFQRDVSLTVEGVRFHLCHGAPGDDEFRLAEDENPAEVESRIADCNADVILAGHTHIPWRRRFGAIEVINDGSVGYPFDGDVRGAWTSLELDSGRVRDVQWHRFEFDREQTIRRLRSLGGEGVALLVRRLRSGRM